MTNIKPARPLPWELVKESAQENPFWHKANLFAGSAGVSEMAFHNRHGQGAQNAAYIAHAANAYPRLVAVLRKCAELADHGPFIGADEAKTLLRELGEL